MPIKLQLKDDAGNFLTGLTLTSKGKKISSIIEGDQLGTTTATTATSRDTFRYDSTASQYIYNWKTTGLSKGTWENQVYINYGEAKELLLEDTDGSTTELVSLRTK